LPAAPVVIESDDRVDIPEPLAIVLGTHRRTFQCGTGEESICEMQNQPLFRAVPLPAEVRPAAAVTLIGDRQLRIALPRK
jgi:hypothetical protein